MTTLQKRAANMRKKAWTPEARAKRAATYAKKKAEIDNAGYDIKDIIVFLERAEQSILRCGNKRISAAESYAMLALTTLRGN